MHKSQKNKSADLFFKSVNLPTYFFITFFSTDLFLIRVRSTSRVRATSRVRSKSRVRLKSRVRSKSRVISKSRVRVRVRENGGTNGGSGGLAPRVRVRSTRRGRGSLGLKAGS